MEGNGGQQRFNSGAELLEKNVGRIFGLLCVAINQLVATRLFRLGSELKLAVGHDARIWEAE
jgi:hypothetical protein